MNDFEAINLMLQYTAYIRTHCGHVTREYTWIDHCADMPGRFDGSEKKAMRWLGFIQGVLVCSGVFKLEEVKEHSRSRKVPL